MSTAMKWLENQNKEPLMQFAEKAGVQVSKSDNKKNIATAIYNRLVAERSAFENNPDPLFAGFYRRLESPPSSATSSRTPARKAPAVEVASPASPALRSARRQAPKREESTEAEASSESEASTVEGPEQTPKRVGGIELPPSPAVITEAIDRQSAALSKRVNDAWSASGVEERSHALREKLSSVKAVEAIVVALEGFNILRELWPLQYVTTLPAVDSIHTPELEIKLPDFFTLFDGVFWAPFSLWLLTSVFLPLVVAYFFNLSLQHSSTTGSRRGAKASASTFDPLAFNVAKALLAYLVYGKHFTFWDVYSELSIDKIYASVPGQLNGLFTGAGVGLLGALYEAILRK